MKTSHTKPHSKSHHKVDPHKIGLIAVIDEVGRGPLAGPLVSAGVILKPKQKLPGLNDSKKLTPLARERLYEKIIKNCISFGIAEISPRFIDQFGLTKAVQKVNCLVVENMKIKPDFILIDGRDKQTIKIPHQTIIKGDTFIREIMAASIIAKVYRDRIMVNLAKKYPNYRFDLHKGYGTRLHQQLIKKHKPE